ncbi:carbohydrate esterase family 16 protein [Scleroderma citrinum Foug A]|uniref:Carbohydrate esterase family 16 protein n=1 Tax=Scleroderma citrinum Foug A TaxID=1036808 RepID=A0A0C3D2D2_9AGAM|nr:carbohydrate esterase family 16 protein [Scleroderma citrinum Foug A]
MQSPPILLILTLVVGSGLAGCVQTTTTDGRAVQSGQIKNLVTFGDSYTDPTFSGYSWETYVAGYGPFNLYSFAKSGATCSNSLTYRPFPPITEYQLPTYINATQNGTIPASAILPNETVYAIWIGTNDVGANALLTDGIGVRSGVSIVEVRKCVVNVVETLYESGARNFVILNMIPLNLTPLYSPTSYPNRFWSAVRNTTEWSVFMYELVRAGNAITDFMFQMAAPRLQGAHIASFDTYALFSDMFANPGAYLNGTAANPARNGPPVYNVTGCIKSCVLQLNESPSGPNTCTIVQDEVQQDAYLWYDELHPSEQADRILAAEITALMKGKPSKWTTWLS